MMAYPAGLPKWDIVQQAIDDQEELEGSQVPRTRNSYYLPLLCNLLCVVTCVCACAYACAAVSIAYIDIHACTHTHTQTRKSTNY